MYSQKKEAATVQAFTETTRESCDSYQAMTAYIARMQPTTMPVLRLFRRYWLELLAVIVTAVIFVQIRPYWAGLRPSKQSEIDLSLRNADYPNTYIKTIRVDLASPDHAVRLGWTGKLAEQQEKGPFLSSPGKGLGDNDCNDVIESNRYGSFCTPKGTRKVEAISDFLPTTPSCRYVTWFHYAREIAFHSHARVPFFPASNGCVRLDLHAAQLIHNNSKVGETEVVVDGTWTPPPRSEFGTESPLKETENNPDAVHVRLDFSKLRDQVIKHEGVRSSVYKDSEGNATVGIGFNLQRGGAEEILRSVGGDYQSILAGTEELSESQMNALLDADLQEAIKNCSEVFPRFFELSDIRQRALVDMMFNLGRPRFESFKKMINAINDGEFRKAADEMKDSRWYVQVKGRGETLEAMIRTDEE
jgi:lysozyme